jgi:hypothetical protein
MQNNVLKTLTGKVQKIYIQKIKWGICRFFKMFFHLRRFVTLDVMTL